MENKTRETHVVYNDCEGEFSLSLEALRWLSDRGISSAYRIAEDLEKSSIGSIGGLSEFDITVDETMLGLTRHSALLVLCIEHLGSTRASGKRSLLRIAKIISDKYIVRNSGGIETVLTPEDIMWIEVK